MSLASVWHSLPKATVVHWRVEHYLDKYGRSWVTTENDCKFDVCKLTDFFRGQAVNSTPTNKDLITCVMCQNALELQEKRNKSLRTLRSRFNT